MESRFSPLADRDPALAAALINRFCRRWFKLRGIPDTQLQRAVETLDLQAADDWSAPDDAHAVILRLGFHFKFSQYWLFDWTGSVDIAERWIDFAAESSPDAVPGGPADA